MHEKNVNKGKIIIIDLGHENSQMIKEDIESFGIEALIMENDISAKEIEKIDDVKGIILNGGPKKNINGFRVDVQDDIYKCALPMYSVDHASQVELDLFTWPIDKEVRLEKIKGFLEGKCKIKL